MFTSVDASAKRVEAVGVLVSTLVSLPRVHQIKVVWKPHPDLTTYDMFPEITIDFFDIKETP